MRLKYTTEPHPIRLIGRATPRQFIQLHLNFGNGKPAVTEASKHKAYAQRDGLNHVALVCDDLSSTEDRVPKYFEIYSHADYELGKRFYFHDDDGIEYETVC